VIKNKYKKNDLEKYIKDNLVLSNLKPIDAIDLLDFPRFDLDTIKKQITLGSYQIEQSYSYLYEHMKQNGNYTILNSDDIINENDFKILTTELKYNLVTQSC